MKVLKENLSGICVLTLKGEKKDAQESDEKGVRRSEMRFGSFERRVAFRNPISEDDIKASQARCRLLMLWTALHRSSSVSCDV